LRRGILKSMRNSALKFRIESLDRDGRGITHRDGKAVFVDGALPGEVVEFQVTKRKPSYELAKVVAVHEASPDRVVPNCRWFGHCGGCSIQHLEFRAQVAIKQRVLEDAFWHIGRLRAEQMLAPIYGEPWSYRNRARLSVRLVRKKGGVLVGFHERRSSFIADMTSCEILPRKISSLLPSLRAALGSLSLCDRLPQVELAVGGAEFVLVLRNLASLSESDEAVLKAFAETHEVSLWLQPEGPDTAAPFWPICSRELSYDLPEFGLTLKFRPTDFTQINHSVNQLMIRRAISLLSPSGDERVLDLFCGLGNFTLPIARRGAIVHGVEGSEALTSMARENALRNSLDARCSFSAGNLFDANVVDRLISGFGTFDKVLIDPPREGAMEVVKKLASAPTAKRIVYVSCDPGTLARDAAVLVNMGGYRMTCAGIVNMFPQTSHVESMALFELG
jgi:23S rRNA (uracil1939-C5)-methyltransferase